MATPALSPTPPHNDEVHTTHGSDLTRITLGLSRTEGRISTHGIDALRAGLAAAATRNSALVVIDSDGPDFCLGRTSGPSDGSDPQPVIQAILDLYAQIAALDAPVAAIVEGCAVGLGCALAGSCDLVYATPNARFSLPELSVGLPPVLALSTLLPSLGTRAAANLVFGGTEIDAAEAQSIGLVSAVAPRETIDATTTAMTARLSGVAAAVRATKRYLRDRSPESPSARAQATLVDYLDPRP